MHHSQCMQLPILLERFVLELTQRSCVRDPFGDHSDSALWSALGRAQMKDAIEALPQMLDMDGERLVVVVVLLLLRPRPRAAASHGLQLQSLWIIHITCWSLTRSYARVLAAAVGEGGESFSVGQSERPTNPSVCVFAVELY